MSTSATCSSRTAMRRTTWWSCSAVPPTSAGAGAETQGRPDSGPPTRLSSRWLDPEDSPEARDLLFQLGVDREDLPIVVVAGGLVLHNPTSRELLDALGLVVTRL